MSTIDKLAKGMAKSMQQDLVDMVLDPKEWTIRTERELKEFEAKRLRELQEGEMRSSVFTLQGLPGDFRKRAIELLTAVERP